ncbi:MAG: SPOR domain-containing protein [Nitrospinae bacterium]|nr:SPOR domain-containing protein [Nitrospinota bacterium]
MDDGLREDHEFDEVDHNLDDFAGEFKSQEKSKTKRLLLAVAGVALGVGAVLVATGMLDGEQAAVKPAPQKLEAKAEQAPQLEESEAQMAVLQKQNLIDADDKAPGAVDEKDIQLPATNPMEGFAVQVAGASDVAWALALKDDLSAKGFNSWISIGKLEGKIYSVETGDFKTGKEAEQAKAALEKAGFEPKITKQGNEGLIITAGVFTSQSAASDIAARLKGAGFDPRTIQRDGGADIYIVRVGRYESREEASKAAEKLKTSGHAPIGIVE